ncbi:MAG: ornithine carbamoyltransferase [candidate division NC10 bacterium]|nr:ornithine carbamoyltransferase [candidate division NC10 bacterium]
MNRHLVTLDDLTPHDIETLFEAAAELKAKRRQGVLHPLLSGKTLAMIFEKPSLRTRVTFEAGMTQLGGHAIYLTPADIRLGERETVQDAARNLERWVDGIVARTFSHQMVLFTLWEKRGRVRDLRVVFVGDGNNVCHSWLEGAAKVGLHFTLACPKGYGPDPGVLAQAQAQAGASGATLEVTHDPAAAVRGADVLYTDVWTSMGQEEERARRLKDFQGFQVDDRLVGLAAPDVLVMHCLPAHRGEEITDAVMDGPHSIVFDEAENRLHMQKAILVHLLGGKG